MFVWRYPDIVFINIDALTYAGKIDNINKEVQHADNYIFEQCNINNISLLREIYAKHNPTDCIHFAAESHVDNSIKNPSIFLETNVLGTNNLLLLHKEFKMKRFYYISTDEVYGELPLDDGDVKFTEQTPLSPSSPYSVSKASWDMLTQSFGRTYGMDIVVSRCSNNYGPNQDTEKLIPHFISKLMNWQKVPLYGDWSNIRDWLYVSDHCEAIRTIFDKAIAWSIYNIWTNNELANREIAYILINHFWYDQQMIEYVTDRLWHDKRYAIDSSKLQRELWWKPQISFELWIEKTISWYTKHLSP